jgi:hypothetical protein
MGIEVFTGFFDLMQRPKRGSNIVMVSTKPSSHICGVGPFLARAVTVTASQLSCSSSATPNFLSFFQPRRTYNLLGVALLIYYTRVTITNNDFTT